MVQLEFYNDHHEERIILQPNRSMEWRTLKKVLYLISAVILIVPLFLAMQGAWLVLPFAGLEILGLATGFWYVFHKQDRQQVLRLDDERVVLEQGRHHPQQSWVCHRPWCRFRVYHRHPWYPRELWLRCHRHKIQIGEFLNDDERKKLQKHLDHLLIHD